MANKERLEEIDGVVDDLLNNRGELTNFVNDYYLQTERVQELEEHLRMANQYVEKEREINNILRKRNKRYREAIKKTFKELKYGDSYNAELILVEALEGEE